MTAAAAPTNFALIRQPAADNPALLNLLIVDDERSVRDACREAEQMPVASSTAQGQREQILLTNVDLGGR